MKQQTKQGRRTRQNGVHPAKQGGPKKATRRERVQNGQAARKAPNFTALEPKAEPKGKLDTITFIYGFGAAVVLVGAMFKFLGWPFANELFIVGLSIEAVVFLISAFERKEDEMEYKWENVFPQLQGQGTHLNGAVAPAYGSAMDQFAYSLNEMTVHLKDLTTSLQDIKGSLQESSHSSKEMKEQMGEFNSLMDHYNDNLRFINERYDEVLG